MKINSELIQLCIAGNRPAQKQLYTVLLPYLNVISQRYLDEDSQRKDVLQEAFINIFKNLNQFDSSKAGFKTWAAKITINCCLKNNRKYKNNKTDEEFVRGLRHQKENQQQQNPVRSYSRTRGAPARKRNRFHRRTVTESVERVQERTEARRNGNSRHNRSCDLTLARF